MREKCGRVPLVAAFPVGPRGAYRRCDSAGVAARHDAVGQCERAFGDELANPALETRARHEPRRVGVVLARRNRRDAAPVDHLAGSASCEPQHHAFAPARLDDARPVLGLPGKHHRIAGLEVERAGAADLQAPPAVAFRTSATIESVRRPMSERAGDSALSVCQP